MIDIHARFIHRNIVAFIYVMPWQIGVTASKAVQKGAYLLLCRFAMKRKVTHNQIKDISHPQERKTIYVCQ
jgi:hypothetical protein